LIPVSILSWRHVHLHFMVITPSGSCHGIHGRYSCCFCTIICKTVTNPVIISRLRDMVPCHKAD
jgi:hypothetical protein